MSVYYYQLSQEAQDRAAMNFRNENTNKSYTDSFIDSWLWNVLFNIDGTKIS